jgi:hypothetical protein
MDRRELDGLLERARVAQAVASDLGETARVLRSESAEGRLERADTRRRTDSATAAARRPSLAVATD